MHLYLDVQSRAEADQIRRGLADPTIRAMVTILGALLLAQEQQHHDVDDKNFTRVEPGYAGADRQDRPQSDHEALSMAHFGTRDRR